MAVDGGLDWGGVDGLVTVERVMDSVTILYNLSARPKSKSPALIAKFREGFFRSC